jgi:EamA domain-containing membrane protein RarD
MTRKKAEKVSESAGVTVEMAVIQSIAIYIPSYHTTAFLHGALETLRLSTILATITAIPVVANELDTLRSLVGSLRPHV